ncbi:uncharacterized protein LOC119107769 [Pollicipes pollicipes]|uniref:uncharacterized protein LOC119107769 n=1 Tax=Pollicipes pollicipes TaxID=41117 RepID=UPI001884FC95|nr:uncharacterized protein LOC119107769 [Pollicipes pollicipes]XP_037087212.1 uncharacterized protein LOC119107769 [Pollicipes pollicipes]XP_037087213.1 uncharacterized protein LOC119107769 [Pollicipes pollicipes]
MATTVEEVEEAGDSIPTHAYPCPTCGMLFSESDMCDTHASFCSQSDDPGGDWTEERVHLLVDCMDARYAKFVQMSPKERKHHWKRTAHVVGATADETRHRWNQLISSYNRIKLAKAHGRSTAADRWQYYEKMDNILGERVSVRPEFVISSMPLETSADGTIQPGSGMLLSPEGDVEVGGTSKLIELMQERYPRYTKMSPKRRKMLWQEIADLLGVSPDEARIRWNMLVGSYKRTKFNRTMKRGVRKYKHKWQYFEQMDKILGDKYKPVMPLLVLSSRPIQPNPTVTFSTAPTLFTTNAATSSVGQAATTGTTSTATASVLQIGPTGLLQAAPGVLQPGTTGILQPGTTGILQQGTTGILQQGTTGILQQGTTGILQQGTPNVQTVLQGTPAQQAAEVEMFTSKRKALFVEEYLRAKARREELRLQLEERRIRALERLVDTMEARSQC